MRTRLFQAVVLAVALTARASSQDTKSSGTIQVVVKGIENTKGRLGIALYRDASGFPEGDNAFRQVEATPQIGQVAVELAGLPAGVYAIGVRHDENGNNKLDKNGFGAPTEGWGVSNNIKHRFRAPKFGEAQFTFAGKAQTIEIKLNY